MKYHMSRPVNFQGVMTYLSDILILEIYFLRVEINQVDLADALDTFYSLCALATAQSPRGQRFFLKIHKTFWGYFVPVNIVDLRGENDFRGDD